MTESRRQELEAICRQFRIDVLEIIHERQSGHTGGSFSVCEILAALYLECANINKDNYKDPSRDRIILSKGHASPMLYRCLAEKEIIKKEDLKSFRTLGGNLQGHPCSKKTPGVELSTGPLGLGLAAGVGMACSNKLLGNSAYTFVVMGDGEINEGTIWEGAMSAAKFGCERLVAILDWNKVQLDGKTADVMPMDNMPQRWEAFGWNVLECDGHDIAALCDTIEEAKTILNGKPTIVLANTVKGKGVSFMENTNKYHGKAIDDDEYSRAMAELRG